MLTGKENCKPKNDEFKMQNRKIKNTKNQKERITFFSRMQNKLKQKHKQKIEHEKCRIK